MIRASLCRTVSGRAPLGQSRLIHDLLWAHATPAEGLEHIRPRPTENGLDLFLFVRAHCNASALEQMRTLLTRLNTEIAVHGYTVADF
ncbi:hypothetical protein [Embleya scabrispora]|uniref:hypothetical protein n=1 Tax=Embleya scabrispora TaxID=159449 RepID=UPI001319EF49|nr:hypothetical protein [Embleya scabrispora]MYS87993.1 hypothetical protein [Streptomyces sp. SID5474]